MRKYSSKVITKFNLFLSFYRSGIITFCGSSNNIQFDKNGEDGVQCFINFENGIYKNKPVITKHPNIVNSFLTGKKGWGLWMKEWSNGIREGSFKKQDILDEFINKKIELPESFLQEFDNLIYRSEVK